MDSDHTKIALHLDPTLEHMVGTASHGNTPFDVPYITEIAPNLWQGGCADGLILPKEIKHVISLYPWEHYTFTHNLDSMLSVRMFDAVDQPFEQVEAIGRWVNDCRDDGITLVHCQAGLNRSSLVVAYALIIDGMPPKDAIELIRAKRSPACLCNKAFEAWLLDLA